MDGMEWCLVLVYIRTAKTGGRTAKVVGIEDGLFVCGGWVQGVLGL